ncbi:MAG: hypothetical protein SYC29_14665 [Planctomycetota bacterium]|nr:hypothetical protein [Planctomycetota bacterium]
MGIASRYNTDVMRRARSIVVFLLLGAIVNIAVAWSVTALTTWPGEFDSIEEDEQEIQWPRRVPERWPPPEDLIRYRSFGWSLDRCVAIVEAGEGNEGEVPVQYMIESVRVGWPLRGLRWERWVDGEPTQPVSGGAGAGASPSQRTEQATPGAWRSGIALQFQTLGFDPDDGKRLPICPTWIGFITNTLLYAIVLWLSICIPRVIRALIRIFRGRCPNCGYDLRGAPPEFGAGGGCPECGWNRELEAKT